MKENIEKDLKRYAFCLARCIDEETQTGILDRYPEVQVNFKKTKASYKVTETSRILSRKRVELKEFHKQTEKCKKGHYYICRVSDFKNRRAVVEPIMESFIHIPTKEVDEEQIDEIRYIDHEYSGCIGSRSMLLYAKAFGIKYRCAANSIFVTTPAGHWRIEQKGLYHESSTLRNKGYGNSHHKQITLEAKSMADYLTYIIQHDIGYKRVCAS